MQLTTSETSGPVRTSPSVELVFTELSNGHFHRNMLPYPDEASYNSIGGALRCEVDLGSGAVLRAYSIPSEPDKIFIGTRQEDWYGWAYKDIQDVDPFIEARIVGNARHKMRPLNDQEMREKYNPRASYGYSYSYSRWTPPARKPSDVVLDTYGGGRSYDYNSGGYTTKPGKPWNYVDLELTVDGQTFTQEVRFQCPQEGTIDLGSPENSVGSTLTVGLNFFGKPYTWTESVSEPPGLWQVLRRHTLVNGDYTEVWRRFLRPYLNGEIKLDEASLKSLKKRKSIAPVLERLREEEPLLMAFFEALQNSKSRDKTTNNRLLAAFLKDSGEDYDQLKKGLQDVLAEAHTHNLYSHGREEPVFRNVCLAFPQSRAALDAVKAKNQWQFRKTVEDKADGLGISMHAFPLLMDAIGEGHIPLGVFHESGEKDHLINVEFDLWERALERGWLDVLSGIAQNCAGRKKYTRQITSYISFLFKIEKYLNRHAPRPEGGSWKAEPKYVESQWELEMDEADEEGTVKRRSALTPVADNEKGTIMVPYAAMAIHGRQVTYCYSHNYYVVEEGMVDPEGKGVFTKDLEIGLNGRDDYGLMWYTLTGTPRNTGYPTFLVIFERTNRHGTRVHFHRVHPSRSRGPKRTPTPTSRMIRECYRYMAGNVTVDQIHAQQGDMLFIKTDGPGKATEDPVNVAAFENHAFVTPEDAPPAQLVRSVAKAPTNRLGYLYSESAFTIDHPEHEPVPPEVMQGGWYEVRRCKSWEANPTAVWSFTID